MPLVTIGDVFCACFPFFSFFPLNIFSLRTADWGQGDSGGPRQVVQSTRTGFGFLLSRIGL
jgi:hypothetical protein